MERNFQAMYRILKRLEAAMDCEDGPDMAALTPEALKLTPARLDSIWALLAAEGYVTGAIVSDHGDYRVVALNHPRVTMRGLEFLADNSMMRRAARAAKGIKDAVPGIPGMG